MSFKPDDQVEMNIASLNRVENRSRVVFFEGPIKVGNSLIKLLALVADGQILVVYLGANWLKTVGACLDVSWLKLVVTWKSLS